MAICVRMRGSMLLALGGLVLGLAGRAEPRFPYPKDHPHVQTPPPKVTEHPPPGGGNTGGGPPGGGTQQAPEPATLLSSLLGAGLVGFYTRRRKQVAG